MITGPLPVRMEDAFPAGALAFPGVAEPAPDWDHPQSDGSPGQQVDAEGLPLFLVRVVDPSARRGQAEITVKVAAISAPVIPEITGSPFTPVIFDDLAVIPYVRDGSGRARIAYSWRATGVNPVGGSPSRKPGGDAA